jgi:hypothetical protein
LRQWLEVVAKGEALMGSSDHGADGVRVPMLTERLGEDPKGGALLVFCNRRHNRLQVLYFDGSALWVLTKRLARGTFSWPKALEPDATKLCVRPGALIILIMVRNSMEMFVAPSPFLIFLAQRSKAQAQGGTEDDQSSIGAPRLCDSDIYPSRRTGTHTLSYTPSGAANLILLKPVTHCLIVAAYANLPMRRREPGS